MSKRKNKYLVLKKEKIFISCSFRSWEIFPNVGTIRTGFSRTFHRKMFYLSKKMGARIFFRATITFIKPKTKIFTSHYIFFPSSERKNFHGIIVS